MSHSASLSSTRRICPRGADRTGRSWISHGGLIVLLRVARPGIVAEPVRVAGPGEVRPGGDKLIGEVRLLVVQRVMMLGGAGPPCQSGNRYWMSAVW